MLGRISGKYLSSTDRLAEIIFWITSVTKLAAGEVMYSARIDVLCLFLPLFSLLKPVIGNGIHKLDERFHY